MLAAASSCWSSEFVSLALMNLSFKAFESLFGFMMRGLSALRKFGCPKNLPPIGILLL